MQPRRYQQIAIDNVASEYRAGHQGVVLVLPTGGGKTVVYSLITRELEAAGHPVLIVEPGTELVEQTRDKLVRCGVRRVGVISAGWRGEGYRGNFNPDPGALVQVASPDTLRSRPDAILRAPRLTIYDEGHLSAAATYQGLMARFPSSRRLITTATPRRLDGQGFRGSASAIVVGSTVKELQELGALVPFRTLSIPLTDFARSTRRPGGEFNLKKMSAAYNKQQLVGDVVAHYTEHAEGRSALCFAASVEHSKELRDAFNACGYRAEHVDGTTPSGTKGDGMRGYATRCGILERLEAGITEIVCNFGILTAGFDCPRVACVIVARATASWSLWIQMAGRGLRPWAEGGKIDCVILDHGGNALRHGNLAHPHVFSLDGKEHAEAANDDAELGKVCPQCQTVIDTCEPFCTSEFNGNRCGFDFRAHRIAGTRGAVQSVDGQLVEIAADAGAFELRAPPTKAEVAAEKSAERAAVRAASVFEKKQKIDRAHVYAEKMRRFA